MFIINNNDYDSILKEHFDCIDRETRKTMLTINEADQESVLTSLTSKLYDHIVNKIEDIDFGSIPQSQGDITKIENYDQMCDCLDVIQKYLMQYKLDGKDTVDVIQEAIINMVNRKDIFQKGFKFEIEFVAITYSSLVLAIVESVGMLITSAIEFIKEPGQDNFKITVDKVGLQKTKNNLLFTNLKKFNKSCSKKEFDKAMEYVVGNVQKNFVGTFGATTGAVAGVALAGIILNIIPIIRELIFFFYHSRVSISDYLETQADLLQINSYNLENNPDINSKRRKEITTKQMKIVELFRKLANFIGIDNKKAEIKATKDAKETKQKYKVSDVVDSKPDSAEVSAGSSLF